MHQARQQALQELALPHHDDCFGARSAGNVIDTRNGFAHADQAVEEQRAPAEEDPRNDQCDREDARGHRVHFSFRTSAEIAGTTSRRSPITA